MTHSVLPALAAATLAAAALAIGLCPMPAHADDAPYYHPITPRASGTTVTLTGHDLTLDQVIAVARDGARVALSAQARQRSADAHGLLLEAAAEGVPVYWFTRGVGSSRENAIFSGDPTSPANREFLLARQLAVFKRGALAGLGPEIDAEEIVRAMMVIRANSMSYEAASPQLTQRLLDLLNDRITPVVQSRSTVGEGDLGPFANIGATMVGAGNAYYQGVRMDAASALKAAGLEPLAPFGADDSELESTNAYATAQAALMLFDARQALGWADLTYAVDLNGMNSSISPLAQPVQANRPFPWINWDAARVLGMLKGSYLFDLDAKRIIQDPESLRASTIRQGSAWAAWAHLRDTVVLQMNSSDHNPAVRVGSSPSDSWELATPQLSQFFVKGGKLSHGQHGFILSNANWDPYPMANDIEAFSIALANLDVAVAQRMIRFSNPFFTVLPAGEPTPGEPGRFGVTQGSELIAAALMQEIQGQINPVPPEGDGIVKTVEDLQAQTRLKAARARTVVADTFDLLAEDLLTGTYWLDLRKAQEPAREFGPAATSVWTAFRQVVPATGAAPAAPIHDVATRFVRTHPPATFYPDEREPGESPKTGESRKPRS